jgi:hypothetical protein
MIAVEGATILPQTYDQWLADRLLPELLLLQQVVERPLHDRVAFGFGRDPLQAEPQKQ